MECWVDGGGGGVECGVGGVGLFVDGGYEFGIFWC